MRATSAEEFDFHGDSSETCHQSEGLQIVVPELGLASETTPLDRGWNEIEATVLGFLHNLLVELEGGLVLRGVGRDEPAIISDWDEDTDIHFYFTRRILCD